MNYTAIEGHCWRGAVVTFDIGHAEAALQHVLFKVAWRSWILLALLSPAGVNLEHHLVLLSRSHLFPLLLLCRGTERLGTNVDAEQC